MVINIYSSICEMMASLLASIIKKYDRHYLKRKYGISCLFVKTCDLHGSLSGLVFACENVSPLAIYGST